MDIFMYGVLAGVILGGAACILDNIITGRYK